MDRSITLSPVFKKRKVSFTEKGIRRIGFCICFTFFVAGIVVILQGKSMFLGDNGVLSRSRLEVLSNSEFPWVEYALYLLQKRLPFFLLLFLLGCEKRNGVALLLIVTFISFVMGLLVTEGMVRYGFKGLALVLLLGFPQGFLYIGCMLLIPKIRMIQEKLCRLLVSLLIFLLFFGGIVTESLLNTIIMRKVLLILP